MVTMTTFSGHCTVRKGQSPFFVQHPRNSRLSGKILDGWQPYGSQVMKQTSSSLILSSHCSEMTRYVSSGTYITTNLLLGLLVTG